MNKTESLDSGYFCQKKSSSLRCNFLFRRYEIMKWVEITVPGTNDMGGCFSDLKGGFDRGKEHQIVTFLPLDLCCTATQEVLD